MNFDGLDISILGPAFIAGLLVLATHVPLGQEVLKRGIIFSSVFSVSSVPFVTTVTRPQFSMFLSPRTSSTNFG